MLYWTDQILRSVLLILTVGLVLLWFRSHSVGDRYSWQSLSRSTDGATIITSGSLRTGQGGIGLMTDRYKTHDPDAAQRLRGRALRRMQFNPSGYMRLHDARYPVRSNAPEAVVNSVGIHYHADRRGDGAVVHDVFGITLPLWMLSLVTAIYPLARFFQGVVARERRERVLLGLCPRCGTDVRQQPDRCPGCGKPVPQTARQLAAG